MPIPSTPLDSIRPPLAPIDLSKFLLHRYFDPGWTPEAQERDPASGEVAQTENIALPAACRQIAEAHA